MGFFLCRVSLGKRHADGQPSAAVRRVDAAAHLLRQQSGDGQTQTGGAAGRLHGEEAVKKALRLYPVQAPGAVRKGHGAIRHQPDDQVSIGILGGVAENVVKDPPQRGGVQLPHNSRLRQLDGVIPWADSAL